MSWVFLQTLHTGVGVFIKSCQIYEYNMQLLSCSILESNTRTDEPVLVFASNILHLSLRKSIKIFGLCLQFSLAFTMCIIYKPLQEQAPVSHEYPHKQRIRNLRRLIADGKIKPTSETLIFFLCNKFAVSDERQNKISVWDL